MSETPFTTSKVIARFAGVQHHAVQQMCAKYRADLEEFGVFAFEMRAVKEPGARGTKFEKIYHLNEGQAVLLLSFLQNTPQVRAFKKALVMQFQRMKAELTRREVNRAKALPARRTLTDAVRDCLPDTPNKSRWYKIYTDFAYRVALGMDAAHIRKERGADRTANAIEYLTSDEMKAVEKVSGQIAVLIEAGMSYQEIQDVLCRRNGAALRDGEESNTPSDDGL
ncbi:MAG: Rha family transcriptional regulator [Oscillibacter sp.]|nr:Rha family transcriptional regulator [Oscillibacter sp.]